MKQIEALLKLDLLGKFDTPKKINRSTAEIPADIVESLEAGDFTTEMIDELSTRFPIFRYRTCITVHGLWPSVVRERIGGYRNVIQNKNGSVEVRYSAIDSKKIDAVRELVYRERFRFSEDSNSRSFTWAQVITKETFAAVREQMEPVARELTGLNIYGHVNLYIGEDMFRKFLCVSVYPLAVPQTEIENMAVMLTGKSIDVLRVERDQRIEAERIENERREQERKERQAANAKRQAELVAELRDVFKPQIAHLDTAKKLEVGRTYVKPFLDSSRNALRFVYYRIDSNGSFGRVNWSKGFSDKFSDVKEVEFKEQTQKKLKEFKVSDELKIVKS